MSGRFILDTNIVIALFAGDTVVKEHLRLAEEVFLSSIVLGELYFGAQKSGQIEANLKRIDELATSTSVLVCDAETARRYGGIKNALRLKGRPIPENDIWISAMAKQYGLVLVTRDIHFDEIQDLNIENWQ